MPKVGDRRAARVLTSNEKREHNRQFHLEKNARRKASRTHNPQRHAARELRRAFGGAFGRARNNLYNFCIIGTTGEERTSRVAVEEDLPTLKDGVVLGKNLGVVNL